MKIKHQREDDKETSKEQVPTYSSGMPLKRARGRPRKYADNFSATTHTG